MNILNDLIVAAKMFKFISGNEKLEMCCSHFCVVHKSCTIEEFVTWFVCTLGAKGCTLLWVAG